MLLALGLMLSSGHGFRAAPQGQAPGATTLGFLVVRADHGMLNGKFEEECPNGWEMSVEEGYLATKTRAERERLLLPANSKEYARGWQDEFITGPNGENVCNNPKSFMNDPKHSPYRGVASKTAFGMNLDGTPDGRATANTCGHQKFTGVNGEPGVDNQFYRAMGCSRLVRVTGAHTIYLDEYLIEIRGVDDLKNDDHVDIGIYSTDDTSMKGSDGNALAHQTLAITKNAHWRATAAGRIVNGEVISDVFASVYLRWFMPTWGVLGEYEHEFHDARLRMTIHPDGLYGTMASYRPIENILTRTRCCKGTASVANSDCASEHKTLVMMADGYPDPATGQCTMISSAVNFTGVPVFIVHPREKSIRE
jgi:hypothetical protein